MKTQQRRTTSAMQLSINIPDHIWKRLEELSKAELVRLIRVGQIKKPTTAITKKKKNLMHYFGSAKGVYASANEADKFIRNERNSWE